MSQMFIVFTINHDHEFSEADDYVNEEDARRDFMYDCERIVQLQSSGEVKLYRVLDQLVSQADPTRLELLDSKAYTKGVNWDEYERRYGCGG